MRAMWQLWAGGDALADECCSSIIRHAMALPEHAGTTGHESYQHGALDLTRRSAGVRWLEREDPDFAQLFRLIDERFATANRNAFGFDSHYTTALQFTSYVAERNGHFDWHSDVFWETNRVFQRKLSMVIQLSDPQDYDGGELELDVPRRPDPAHLRRRGALIVFPAFVQHRVLPLTRGRRFSLVAWQEGPPWR